MSKWIPTAEALRRADRSREWLRVKVQDGLIRHMYETVDGQRRLLVHAGDVERHTPGFVPKGHRTRRVGGVKGREIEIDVGDPVTVTVNGRRGIVASAPEHKRFVVVEYATGYCETWRYNEIKVEGSRK